MTIDEDGISNTVSVDRSTSGPTATKTPAENNSTQGDENNTERKEKSAVDTRLEEENVPKVPREYSMDRIVRHIGKDDSFKQVVHWYSSMPADNTLEPSNPFSDHLITRWRCRVRKQDEGNRYRKREIENDKERTSPTVQASTVMIIQRRNTNKYPGYMLSLSMIRQGGE